VVILLPSRYTTGEKAPSTHWLGGWVGHQASLNMVTTRKISHQEPNPRCPACNIVTIQTEISGSDEMPWCTRMPQLKFSLTIHKMLVNFIIIFVIK